jgi:hypothetical protein
MEHFQNATAFQFEAINELKIGNVQFYISFMNIALEKYNEIVI